MQFERWTDDAEWAWKATIRPYPARDGKEYEWQASVPSLYRWFTNALPMDSRKLDVSIGKNPNGLDRFEGYVPPAMRNGMRLASIALYALMLGLLWLIAFRILSSPTLAALALLPVAMSETFWNCVAWRTGPDALLCLMLVGTLAAWLWLSGWKQFVVVSVLAGLACASKQNGILVLAAWCGWLVFTGRGSSRAWRPLVAITVAATVFCLINPATWSGPWRFLTESIRVRTLWAEAAATRYGKYGPHTWWQLWTDALPVWPLVPFYGWLLWRCRREAWFGPVAWWGSCLALGTLLTIPSPVTRYLAPLELGLYFPAMLAVLHILARVSRATRPAASVDNARPAGNAGATAAK